MLAAALDGADVEGVARDDGQAEGQAQERGDRARPASTDGKVTLIAGVTSDLTAKVKAGELVNHVAQQVGGKGGGRADMAQAGGTNPAALPRGAAVGARLGRRAAVRGQRCISHDALVDRDADAAKCIS